jgi:hypothetical protein
MNCGDIYYILGRHTFVWCTRSLAKVKESIMWARRKCRVSATLVLVSSPDPPSQKEGKGSGDFGLMAGSGHARRHGHTWTKLGSDWSTSLRRQFKFVYRACNGTVTFLWYASHVTELKLRSDWDAQIPLRVNWTKLLPKVTRPFSLLEGRVWGRDYDRTQTPLFPHCRMYCITSTQTYSNTSSAAE